MVSAALVMYFGNVAPSFYALIASVVIVIIIATMPETKGIELEE